MYKADSLHLDEPYRFESDSDFLRDLKRSWDERLKEAFRQMPPMTWAKNWDKSDRGQSGA
jgi:putative proteasome-type protease